MNELAVKCDLHFLTLFNDLTITINDGVGYITSFSKNDVMELYKAIKELIKNEKG